ncbi:hypothetical protein C8F01DRAFT_1367437, partial [Mycena amicta]
MTCIGANLFVSTVVFPPILTLILQPLFPHASSSWGCSCADHAAGAADTRALNRPVFRDGTGPPV